VGRDQIEAIFLFQQPINQHSIDLADELDTPLQILFIASSLA